jgi:hypothetical protein
MLDMKSRPTSLASASTNDQMSSSVSAFFWASFTGAGGDTRAFADSGAKSAGGDAVLEVGVCEAKAGGLASVTELRGGLRGGSWLASTWRYTLVVWAPGDLDLLSVMIKEATWLVVLVLLDRRLASAWRDTLAVLCALDTCKLLFWTTDDAKL